MEELFNFIHTANKLTAAICHILAMLVIIIGVVKSVTIYLKDIFTRAKSIEVMEESRLEIGHSFSLALALLIGASILNTTLAPGWNEIGQLAAIITIRTTLNYFLISDLRKFSVVDNDESKKTL